jgi:hypothetical protein
VSERSILVFASRSLLLPKAPRFENLQVPFQSSF